MSREDTGDKKYDALQFSFIAYSWVIHICDDGNIHLRGDIVFEDTKQYFVVKTERIHLFMQSLFAKICFCSITFNLK